jgi:hypothetical protein
MDKNFLFNIVTWILILGSFLYFIVALIRKSTRAKAEQAIEQAVPQMVRVMSWYLKGTLFIIILAVVASIILILVFRVLK